MKVNENLHGAGMGVHGLGEAKLVVNVINYIAQHGNCMVARGMQGKWPANIAGIEGRNADFCLPKHGLQHDI